VILMSGRVPSRGPRHQKSFLEVEERRPRNATEACDDDDDGRATVTRGPGDRENRP